MTRPRSNPAKGTRKAPATARRTAKRGVRRTDSIGQKERLAKQNALLEHYRGSGNVLSACKAAGIARSTHYEWLGDPDYMARFRLAEADAGDVAEAEAWRRAIEGVRKPIGFYKGKPGAVVREYSDRLLESILKAHNPKYRDRQELTGANGTALFPPEVRVMLIRPTAEEG